jgi:hypothetical protein
LNDTPPPEAAQPVPTAHTIDPAAPLAERPVVSVIGPELRPVASVAEPDDNDTDPLTPEDPETALHINIAPLELSLPFPLANRTPPPD